MRRRVTNLVPTKEAQTLCPCRENERADLDTLNSSVESKRIALLFIVQIFPCRHSFVRKCDIYKMPLPCQMSSSALAAYSGAAMMVGWASSGSAFQTRSMSNKHYLIYTSKVRPPAKAFFPQRSDSSIFHPLGDFQLRQWPLMPPPASAPEKSGRRRGKPAREPASR